MLTPYQFASNRPIDGIDLDGLEWKEIKHDFASAWEGIKNFGTQTAEGLLHLANNPSKIIPTVYDGVKQSATDRYTLGSGCVKITSNQLLGTEFEINPAEIQNAGRRRGQEILTEGAGALIGQVAKVAKPIAKSIQNVKVEVSVDPSYVSAGINPKILNIKASWKIPIANNVSSLFSILKKQFPKRDYSPKQLKEIQDAIGRSRSNDNSLFPNNDGKTYNNSPEVDPNSKILDTGENYLEYTVRTVGENGQFTGNRGSKRIVVGQKTGRTYYSDSHYENFIEIKF